jgi:hypothetical protein
MDAALQAEPLAERGDGGLVVRVWVCTRSLPTAAFRASGVSSTTILPWSMMAIR